MSLRLLLLMIVFHLAGLPAWAARRTVNLEWEADSDANTYEIEIGPKGSPQAFLAMKDLDTPQWTGKLKPGNYWMHVRGRDVRNVAGDWSDSVDFEVKLDAPVGLAPTNEATLKSTETKMQVEFRWQPVEGADAYSLVVLDDKQKPVLTQRPKETTATVTLPTAMKYTWFVQALDESGAVGEKPKNLTALLLEGAPPMPPLIKKPESAFVRHVDLSRPADADSLRITVQRFDERNKDWVKLQEGRVRKGAALAFKPEWPGGSYQVIAVSEAKYRTPSRPVSISFDVAHGSRTIASENQALIRKAIDRSEDWFFTASYIIAPINYFAKITEENHAATLSPAPITGTGLLGLGRFWTNSPFGFYASVDYGGVIIANNLQQFLGVEAAGLFRWAPQRRSDFRLKLGAFRREIPEVLETQPVRLGNLTSLGPSAGAEFWYSLSPRLALQTSFEARFNAKGTSARGFALEPTTSYNAGFMGGLKLPYHLWGLAGYSYRVDQFSFAGNNEALGITHAKNEIQISGHYLHLILEYDF